MLARNLRVMIAFETAFYLLLTGVLHTRGLIGGFGAVLWMVGLPLLTRALWVGALMVSIMRSAPRLSIPGWAGWFLREWLAHLRLFGLLMPFETRWMGADRIKPAREPVVLVHGYLCNRAIWLWMARSLEARGHVVATINLEPLFGDIDDYAAQLEKRIEEVCETSGAARVALVGHSMGGLVCQAYLRRAGGDRVTRLITLGTPFGGSRLARFGPGRNARQMQVGNPWLIALEHAPAALGVEIITIASLHDAFVSPQAASLEGAHCHTLPGLGHLEMAWSPAVLERVCVALEYSERVRKIA